MADSVRLVSDGEEMVLSHGEAFRVVSRGASAGAKQPSIRYLGFRDVEGRREYALQGRSGETDRNYVRWIELVAFAKREARMQDGPDICYQKLLRELAAEPDSPESVAVTAADLAAYKEAHTPAPPRRRPPPPPRT